MPQLSPNPRKGGPLFALRRLHIAPTLKCHHRGQSTLEYALICAFLLIVISATMLRFANLPADLGDLLNNRLLFKFGLHWVGVLTFF